MAADAVCAGSGTAETADPFLTMVPTIRRSADIAFSQLRVDARDELIAEVVAIALQAYRRLVERDKADVAFPSALARFAIRHVKHGRSLTNRLNVFDITSRYCRRLKRVRVRSLHRQTQNGWEEVAVEDRRSTPADVATFRLDFTEWLGRLTRHQRSIVLRLAIGESPSTLAASLGLSAGRISQVRGLLRRSWLEYHGEPTAA